MAKLLLNLRHVPDDEADEVREWLTEHGIEHYETTPSRWGISAGGIWLRHDADYPRARELMDNYQRERYARAKQAQAEARARGETLSWLAWIKNQPAQALGAALAIAGALLLMGLPAYLLSQ